MSCDRTNEAPDSKTWSTLAAKAALRGWQLWRSDAADGPQRFFLARSGEVCVFADLCEVEAAIT